MGTIRDLKKGDGTTTFHAEVRLKGHSPQRASFRTRSLAKRWIQDTESSIRDGRYFRTAESKKRTVKDLIERFISQWLAQFPERVVRQTAYLEWWKNRLGHLLLSDLSPAVLAEARDALLTEKTPRGTLRTRSTANRYLAAFSRALSIATKEFCWLDDNPMSKVSKPSENKGRNRLLTLEEKDRLLKACRESPNPHLHPIVSLALLTGMRFGEIANLRWEDVDYVNKKITLEKTKNGDRRILPLTTAVEKILAECRPTDISTGMIFKPTSLTNRSGVVDIHNAFKKALKAAQVSNLRFHDLRHAAASYMAMSGATQGELMAVLGHRSPQMTRRYAHYSQKHIGDLMERMQGSLMEGGGDE